MEPSTETTAPEKARLIGKEHRRKGKVAKLLKKQRDMVNQMLDDGATYSEIIKKMEGEGAALNHENISNWYEGGYQDWLKEQIWREEIHSRHEAYSDLLAEGQSATRLPEAALQLATTEICRRLHEITLTAQALDATSDPNSFTRLVHALCRLSREVLHLQKYNDALKVAKEGGGKRFDAFRELTEAERQAILDKADDILGCRAYRGLPPLPLKPDLSEPAKTEPSVPSSPSVETQANASPLPTSSAGVSPAVSPTSSRPPLPETVAAAPSGQSVGSVESVPSVPSTPPVESPAPPATPAPKRRPTQPAWVPPTPPKDPSVPTVRPPWPCSPSGKPYPSFSPIHWPGRKTVRAHRPQNPAGNRKPSPNNL